MTTNFTKSDLVAFGNYLLSKEREDSVSEMNQRCVTHADIENFLEKNREVD